MKTKCLILSIMLSSLFSFAQKDEEKLEELLIIADSLYNIENFEASKHLYLKIDSLAAKKDYLDLLIKTKKKISIIFNHLGNPDNSIAYAKECLKIAAKIKDLDNQIFALMYLGENYSNKFEFDIAIEYLEKALQLLDSNNNKPQLIHTKISIGSIHARNNNLDIAKQFFYEALDLAEELKDYRNQSVIYGNLAHCYDESNDYRKAIELGKKAVQICKNNNLKLRFYVPANIASSYENLKKYDSAMYYYQKSYTITLNPKNLINTARVSYRIGRLHTLQKQYKPGIKFYLESYALADSIKHDQVASLAIEGLSKTYQKINDYENSLLYLQKFLTLKSRIDQKSTEKKLEEFQIKYETKQKEERIATLAKENNLKATIIEQEKKQKYFLWSIFISTIILVSIVPWIWQRMKKKRLLAKQENLRFKAVIEAEQKERKRIAQDLHDSLGQSISVIKKRVSILQPASGDESKHKALIQQLDNTYDELRDISHNIMPNTLIMLGLVPAVRELISEISTEDSPKIELDSDIEPKKLNEDQAIALYRIIQEAIANILKHAKATLVNIRLENKNGTTSLYIKDNGKGMDISKINNNSGMGWKNIYSRVALLPGKINIQSQPDHGTSITIHLKNK